VTQRYNVCAQRFIELFARQHIFIRLSERSDSHAAPDTSVLVYRCAMFFEAMIGRGLLDPVCSAGGAPARLGGIVAGRRGGVANSPRNRPHRPPHPSVGRRVCADLLSSRGAGAHTI